MPTSSFASLTLHFVQFPPNPCNANKVAGTLTPTDPNFPPVPWLVAVSGHLRDGKPLVLTGDIPSGSIADPPVPIRVEAATSFPPSPCISNTGTFAGTISIG